MKISPVNGTPIIQQPPITALSPDKIQRAKQIALGQTPEETSKEEVNLGAIALTDTPTSQTQRIKMSVNKTPESLPIATEVLENAAPLEAKAQPQEQSQVSIPDQGVQAKPQPEAIGAVSPELAELAKQKRALQIEREQWLKEKEANKAPADGYIKLDDLKANALSVLQRAGVTYEQLTNEILQNQGQAPQQDLNKFKEELLKTIDEKLAGKDTQQEEAVYNFMRKEVDRLSSLPKYRLIKESNSQDDVMDLVKRMWNEKGEVWTEWEAMDAVEKELREDAKRYARVIGELEETKAPEEKPQAQVTVQKQKTLTNKDSARPPMTRRQRAIAAALGQK